MKPYSFLQGIDAGKLPPEAENYLREEILKSEAIGQISPDAKEFKNIVELITSRYPDALPKGESEKEAKGVTKEDYQKAIKGLTASIKYLPAGDKQKTQAAIKGLKIAMKYQKMEKGGRMPYSDYEGKTAEEVWDGWPGNQKEHFLSDHHNLWASESYEKRSRIIDSKYTKLPFEIQKLIMAHISAGQYAGGGGMEKGGSMAGGVITAEQIWNGWTSNERHNFLKNHNLFPTFYTSDYEYIFNTANSKDTMPDYRVNQIRHAKEVVDTLDKHTSGGSMEKGGFFDSLKKYTKKGYEGAKKGYKKAEKYTKEKIHDKKKQIAIDVLDETRDKIASNDKVPEKTAVKAMSHISKALNIVETEYNDGGKINFSGTALTAEQTKRVNNDILDTQRMLNKELSYSKDLQHADRIAELEAHIVKLNGMIANGWNAPKFN